MLETCTLHESPNSPFLTSYVLSSICILSAFNSSSMSSGNVSGGRLFVCSSFFSSFFDFFTRVFGGMTRKRSQRAASITSSANGLVDCYDVSSPLVFGCYCEYSPRVFHIVFVEALKWHSSSVHVCGSYKSQRTIRACFIAGRSRRRGQDRVVDAALRVHGKCPYCTRGANETVTEDRQSRKKMQ